MTTWNQPISIKTPETCGYSYLPILQEPSVWSMPATFKGIAAPCEVWEERGLYFFKTHHNTISGPYSSELLACQCAAIHQNPMLQYPPKVERSWQEKALCRMIGELLQPE